MKAQEALFHLMPYGAPELKEVARRYMFRGILVGSIAWLVVFLLSFGTSAFLRNRPHETKVIVVPYRELAAPPPLTENTPPPQVAIAQPVAPPTVAVPVPVPDAEAPPEETIASQEEISAATPGVSNEGDNLVVAPPSQEELPKFGEYVYVEELPEAVTKVQPIYPDLAREASVDGTVVVQALVGKDGKVKDTKVVKSVAMLDAAAVTAVRQWVFKPALSNNKPVAVWVAVPVKFTLH
ncbi:MAG: energy transducer TonB [Candidatus Eisenbacteria bacterium]|uniref:Energy transducer TonB n=1 Tax=Eiseniibacteriota bacterium TaxID=2212470 RepID=A0A538TGM3_UNCEI|nr:MAG: energy transducer TonB [Candidatus Eisenbacteria bacterium]